MREKNALRINVARIFARHPFAREILEKLTDAGHEAVLIGGVVRDALLAQWAGDPDWEPEEVDIATSASPDEVKALFPERRILEVGKAFGVLIVVSPEGVPYEVATFRTEGEYDGRRPGRVELVRTLDEDVRRRDFTVNGLAARADGTVIDVVGGVEDLKRKVIRTIGDPHKRFREDYLRLLRAVRFACKLDAHIDPEASAAMKAHRQGMTLISAERVRDELLASLKTKRSARGVKLMDEHGLLELVLPEVAACKGVPQPEEYHPEGDVYTHTLLALKIADGFMEDPLVKLALLLHDIGKREALEKNQGENAAGHDAIGARMAGEICKRLRLSNAETELAVFLVKEHQRIGHFPEMGRGKQVRFLKAYEDPSQPLSAFETRYPWFAKLVQLMIADCQASGMRSAGWLPVIEHIPRLLIQLQELERLTQARRLIDGHDLIELGLPQGPQVGKLLEEIYEGIYAGEIRSREEALDLARRLIESESP
jgi:tRNA nucleotidyltransferase/poly(A) polymerase